MRNFLHTACAVALVATSFGATLLPANAAPAYPSGNGNAELIQVQQRHNSGFERHGNNVYYNGHVGSRQHHPGYREQNGYWFPPEAFGAGVIGGIIGGIIGAQNGQHNNGHHVVTQRLSQQHINWCENKYRSYRASDNTFKPNHGPRQVCASPYMS